MGGKRLAAAGLLLALVLLAACSEEVEVEADPRPAERRGTVFDDQLRALDRARDVERRMMEADEARRRAIDEGTR